MLAQAALHAPPEVALQCVAGHFYYQLSLSFFWSRRLACATRGGVRSKAGHCFHLLFFLSFSTPSDFDLLRGNSRVGKFVSPNILA